MRHPAPAISHTNLALIKWPNENTVKLITPTWEEFLFVFPFAQGYLQAFKRKNIAKVLNTNPGIPGAFTEETPPTRRCFLPTTYN